MTAIVFIASFVLSPMISPGRAESSVMLLPSTTGRVVSFVALFALLAVYFTWSWSNGRRTLPMKTWRIALVTDRGEPLSPRSAFVRYLAGWIGPLAAIGMYALVAPHGYAALAWPLAALNWLAAFVDPERAFLHDRIAATRIVAMRGPSRR